MAEKRRRWVMPKYLEADIRAGYNFVYTDTGEIVSRPAANNKRSFLLEKEETKQIEPSKAVGPAHVIIDGEAQRIEETQENDTETEQRRIPRVEEKPRNAVGNGRTGADGPGVLPSDGGGGDVRPKTDGIHRAENG